MSEPVQCTGNELPEVLAGLRAGHKTPWALDVVGNAGYSVEYFERVPELAPAIAVRQCVGGIISPAGENPVALTTQSQTILCSFCGGSLAEDGTCEICARLWAIREKAVQNRRVYKPKRNDHARLPHPND